MASEMAQPLRANAAPSPSEQVPMPADTPVQDVEAGIDLVAAKAQEWAELAPLKKRDLFAKVLENLKAEQDNLVKAACGSRGYDQTNPQHGHLVGDATILSVGVMSGWVHMAIEFYETLERTGKPPQGAEVQPRPDGSTRVQVLPRSLMDSITGDTGCCLACPLGKAGRFDVVLRGPAKQFDPLKLPPCVVGVLGAGNTDIPNDIIDPMVKENCVVVYKSNPVMARGAEVKRRIFQPLIAPGYLAMFHGGVEQGKAIVDSPKVEKMACTGGVGTFDKIVWGNQDKTDPKAQPIMTKPFLAELGSVNPYIVVPGNWSASDMEHQADKLIAYKMHNNGHICAAPQVLLTCKQWPQREAFLAAVRKQVRECQSYRLFYPGVRKAYEEHKVSLGDGADVTGQQKSLGFGEAATPLLFKTGVSPDGSADGTTPFAFGNEAFGPILVEVPLDTEATFDAFLPAAVDFAQNRCWGTLTCAIAIDDGTKARNQEPLDRIIDGMKFGAVGVNVYPSLANVFPVCSWGGFPGHTDRDVQSGIGQLGNFCCYENLEKTILQGRFTNLLSLSLAGGPQYQEKRFRRLSQVFLHKNLWVVAKFASAYFTGI